MKKEQFTIRLGEKEAKQVKELAKKQDRSNNYILVKLVEIALNQMKK